MKLFLLLPFFFLGLNAHATDYYVSANGNDANNGTTASSSWRTLNKVNSFFSSLRPGDRILLNRGDVFYGSINASKSGTSGSPITISAYGSGNKPVITGFTSVTSWNNLGGNIWESSNAVSTLPYTNMVVVNGVNTAMGRFPNSGMLTYQSHSGQNQITSNGLNGSTNWTGAELALFVTTYTVGRNLITAQWGGTLTFNNDPADDNIQYDNQGFIIQNDPRTLDTLNEWYYNPSNQKLRIYSYGNPTNVQLSTVENLIYLNGNDYITIDNISLQGSNTTSILVKNSKYSTIQNTDINFSGKDGIVGAYWGNSIGLQISNCNINNSNGNGIDLSKDCNNAIVRLNTINNSGSLLGMGSNGRGNGNGSGSYGGIYISGDGSLAEYNSLNYVGYKGISFFGDNSVVQNNFINGFCLLLHDGGGIYTSNAGGFISHTGMKILNNILLNGPTNPGIYGDDRSNGIQITGNSIYNCKVGVYLHNNWNMNVSNNTAFNNVFAGFQINNEDLAVTLHDIAVNGNIFAAKTSAQYSAFFWPGERIIISPNLNFDNNYYARPIDDKTTIGVQTNTPYSFIQYGVSGWQQYSSKDWSSKNSPKAISDINDLRFEYNATSSSKTVSLGANYIDVKNVSYNGSITLAPFTSALLIKNGASTNQPPTAQAGNNQTIALPTSTVTLNGSGVDPDGSISAYTWTKISGPASGTITSPNSPSTTVTSLVQGTYQFQLMVTDNSGATGLATVQVIVNAAPPINTPVANAGTDQSITLPTNTTSLNGSGSVAGGTISAFNWTQTSGPSVGTITNANSASTTVTGLVQGVYQFQLKVTDNNGATATSSMQTSVNAAGNLLPAVNPANTVNGIDYKYYEGSNYTVVPDFSTLTPVKTGAANNFDITLANRATIFSFSFTGYINVPADGQYTFYTSSDDGSMLYIDGVLVVNNDQQHGIQENSGTIGLKAGMHAISVGYFQQGMDKVLTVSYAGPGISKQVIPPSALFRVFSSGGGLLPAVNPANTVNGIDYKYYEGSNYTVVPDFSTLNPVKTGTANGFDISPASSIYIFSFNFTGYINVPSDGQYTFYTSSDDGSLLYIDGVLVVNNDQQHGVQERSGTIGLQAGKHAISVGFFQQYGDKVLTVSYAGPGISKQVIPWWSLFRVSTGSRFSNNSQLAT
ncbi:MAG: PA14 domain-containing protein, partial [Ginsengibacter sp.]